MRPDSAAFARWRETSPASVDERFAMLLRHPGLAEAARRLSKNMLAIAKTDRALDGILKDAGRTAATGLAMYLHLTGGLTLPRLKEICAQTGLVSPGRARAILLYLRFLKYVVPAGGGGRAGLYAPTPELEHAWAAIAHARLDALTPVEPTVMRLSNRLGDPAVMRQFIRIECEIGLRLGSMGGKDNAFWRVFLNRHAGMQILHALMLGAGDTDTYPPDCPTPFSLSQLARDFHVSRPHVARLVRAAEQEGLVVLLGNNRMQLTPEGQRQAAFFLALRTATGLSAATRLHDELAQETLLRAS
jgi:AraC-like DNA-binding protein